MDEHNNLFNVKFVYSFATYKNIKYNSICHTNDMSFFLYGSFQANYE